MFAAADRARVGTRICTMGKRAESTKLRWCLFVDLRTQPVSVGCEDALRRTSFSHWPARLAQTRCITAVATPTPPTSCQASRQRSRRVCQQPPFTGLTCCCPELRHEWLFVSLSEETRLTLFRQRSGPKPAKQFAALSISTDRAHQTSPPEIPLHSKLSNIVIAP